MKKYLFSILFVLAINGTANADHSFKDVMDKKSNITQAVFNLKIAKLGKDGVCDYDNSIQMVAPGGKDNTWRQVIFCYTNQAALDAAKKQLDTNPLKEYGKNSMYGLNVAATIDVTYELNENDFAAGKLISIQVQ